MLMTGTHLEEGRLTDAGWVAVVAPLTEKHSCLQALVIQYCCCDGMYSIGSKKFCESENTPGVFKSENKLFIYLFSQKI